MPLLDLEKVALVAAAMPPDTRPAWLRGMSSASDHTAAYYRFFDAFADRFKPLRVVEIGTYHGTSAAHLAYRNEGGVVITVDIDPGAKLRLDLVAIEHDFIGRCQAITADSVAAASLGSVLRHAPYDVCFIDSLHNFRQARSEYEVYRGLVRVGGLIFFDDISLGVEMERLWASLPEPKRRLDALHFSGFGVVQVGKL